MNTTARLVTLALLVALFFFSGQKQRVQDIPDIGVTTANPATVAYSLHRPSSTYTGRLFRCEAAVPVSFFK
jgi:hypothetical protein